MKIEEEVNIEVAVHRSPIDGALVVDIVTAGLEHPDKIRVNLNDTIIYMGDPEEDENAEAVLDVIRGTIASSLSNENAIEVIAGVLKHHPNPNSLDIWGVR